MLYAGLGLASLSIYSIVRLKTFPTRYLEGPIFRLVQPNFSQEEKQSKKKTEKNWNILIQLSETPGKQKVTHIIWSETAYPFFLSEQNLSDISPMIHAGAPVHFITGAMIACENESLNSIIYISPNKKGTRPLYHKQHLVPFGEYLPLKRFLKMVFPLQWLQWLSPFTRDMLEAEGDCVHQIPGLPPSIMRVCYEIIFPLQHPRPCADWILNVTNDAWFGYSPGPFQHLASTKFRAIEEGLPAVRVANTGVSAMFDGLGRVCGYLPLETRGFLDVQLPKPVPTSYRYLHGWIYFSLLVVGLLGSMWHSYRKKIRR
jgi:apolipoprotein N-acyltransferase